MKKLMCLLLSIMCLCGCSTDKRILYSKTDSLDIPGDILNSEADLSLPFEETISLKCKKDKVSYFTDTIVYKTKDVVSGESRENLKAAIEASFDEDYKKDGITLETNMHEDTLIFQLQIDFKKVDKNSKVLISLGIDSTYFDDNNSYPLDMIDKIMTENEYKKEG